MFKVGDFVYYTDYGRFQDDPELNGYGTILEIKEIQKHSQTQMSSETVAIIQTKYNTITEEFGYKELYHGGIIMSKVDEQLQIEKKHDIFKILNKGLVDLDFFTNRVDTSSGQVTSTYLNAYNKASIQIRNSLGINTEISVYGVGEGMSHLLSIDTIQKAYDYIEVLRKHLTEEPVKEFKKELQEIQRSNKCSLAI